jgi:hypothetical protein
MWAERWVTLLRKNLIPASVGCHQHKDARAGEGCKTILLNIREIAS